MKKFGVKLGKNNTQARLIKVFDSYQEAEAFIKETIHKIRVNEHMYIDIVKEVRK